MHFASACCLFDGFKKTDVQHMHLNEDRLPRHAASELEQHGSPAARHGVVVVGGDGSVGISESRTTSNMCSNCSSSIGGAAAAAARRRRHDDQADAESCS